MNSINQDPQSQNLSVTFLIPGLALFLCAGWTLAFWPGVGTWEVLQFELQRGLPVMNDWKSPFIARIYWLADALFNSTGPVLLIQQVLFWSGLALLTGSTFPNTLHGTIFFLVVAALPPLWITEILLWKEAWTLSFLTLSLGTLFAFTKNRNIWYAVLSVLSAILLTATRHNALFLALPAFYAGAQLIANKISAVKSKRYYLILLVTWLMLVIVALSFFWAVNKRSTQRCHIWHHGLLWDLAAISLAEGKNLIPEAFRKKGQAGSLKRIGNYFTYYNSDPLFFAKKSPLRLFGTAASPCDQTPPLDILWKSWSKSIANYPGAYLRHRLLFIVHLLGISDITRDYFGRKYYRIDSEFNQTINRSETFELLRKNSIYKALVSARLFQGWLYIVVFLLAGLGLARRKHGNLCIWMVWFAGLAYLGTFIAIGSGAVMRYLSVYAILGPALLAGSRIIRNRT